MGYSGIAARDYGDPDYSIGGGVINRWIQKIFKQKAGQYYD